MGTAVGTAIVPGVMFGIVAAQEDWLLAFRAALGSIAVLASVALAVSGVDRRRELRCGGPARPAPLRSGSSAGGGASRRRGGRRAAPRAGSPPPPPRARSRRAWWTAVASPAAADRRRPPLSAQVTVARRARRPA